jgi:hypothetical protein
MPAAALVACAFLLLAELVRASTTPCGYTATYTAVDTGAFVDPVANGHFKTGIACDDICGSNSLFALPFPIIFHCTSTRVSSTDAGTLFISPNGWLGLRGATAANSYTPAATLGENLLAVLFTDWNLA